MSIFLLWESDDNSAITIDGENDDWVGLTTYSDVDSLKVSNSNIDIVEVSYLMDSVYFSIYVGFEDPVFSSTSTNLVRILVDTDQDTSTGFYGPGIGADYYIEISGKAQSVITSNLFIFNDNLDSTNWNGFTALSYANSLSRGVTLETQVPLFDLGLSSNSKIDILVQSNDSFGNSDMHHQILSTDGNTVNVEEKLSALRSETQTFEDEGNPIVIDGYFGDWENVDMLSDEVNEDVPNNNIDIDKYASKYMVKLLIIMQVCQVRF